MVLLLSYNTCSTGDGICMKHTACFTDLTLVLTSDTVPAPYVPLLLVLCS